MKKRKFLIALSLVFVSSIVCAGISYKGVNVQNVLAKEDTSNYWETIFDVETEGEVTFTPNATKNEYNDSRYKEEGVNVLPVNQGSKMTNIANGQPVGLGISVTKDTKFTYKQPVYLNSLTQFTKLMEYFVNPKEAPGAYGNSDGWYPSKDWEFQELAIRLTDVNDENLWVEIKQIGYIHNVKFSVIQVSTPTMAPAGYSQTALGASSEDGTTVNSSLAGVNPNPVAITYDHMQSSAYAMRFIYGTGNKYGNAMMNIARSLLDPTHMKPGDSIFTGFKSEKVKLSFEIKGVSYTRGSANIILMHMLDQSFLGNKLSDTKGPEMEVASDIDVYNLPDAEQNKFYPLWKFKCNDFIDGDVNDSISYEIKDPDNETVFIDLNKQGFVPNKKGVYKVTVTSKDKSNNVTSYKFNLNVVSVIESLELELKELPPKTAKIGETVKVPEYTVSGGMGNINVDVKVLYNNGHSTAVIKDGKFDITTKGNYYISYNVTDYYGISKYYGYNIKASYSEEPVIKDTIVQSYVIANNQIKIPVPKAYDYFTGAGNPIEVETKIEISEDGGLTYKEINTNVYTPTIQSGELYVRFFAYKQGSTTIKGTSSPYVIKVVKPETYSELFQYTSGEYTVEYKKSNPYDQYKSAFFTPNKQGAKITYVNPVIAGNYKGSFAFEKGYANVNQINVKLIDSENPLQTLTFNMIDNGGEKIRVSTAFDSAPMDGKLNTEEATTVGFKITSGYVYDLNNNALFNITKFDNGDDYTGFSSKKVFVEYEFASFDEEKPVTFSIVNFLSLPQFTDKPVNRDLDGPTIVLNGFIEANSPYGNEVTIPSILAVDMVTPKTTIGVKVVSPSGIYLVGSQTANEDASKEYTIKLTEYGKYSITYTATDAYNRVTTLTRNINSYDSIAPQIEIKGQIKSIYKLGESIIIPTYRATDNYTLREELIVKVFLTTPTYGYKLVSVDNYHLEYIFKVPGKYKLTFYVTDYQGNYSYEHFEIKVVE